MAKSIVKLEKVKTILRPFIPPAIWSRRHRAITAALWLKHGGFAPVERNSDLRGRHRGERAFVIGNGPSLNRMDLGLLRNERVFTVNSFFKFKGRWGIRPFCHTMIDPWYFAEGVGDLDELARTTSPETELFFPLAHHAVIASRFADARYLLFSGEPEDNRNTDLTKALPGLRTVTLAAILIALYQGFSPIYLVGCDMDMMNHVVGVSPLRVALRHFYDDAAPEVNEVPNLEYAGYCHSMCIALAGYRFIRETLQPDQQVFNAGIGGMLDVFPRVDYLALFG